ncbi:hypothetical protein DPMN_000561 [Dreissena polymorpha]|uniref:Uncharacterized protein n=1 Tax=Dreissena polymorpha TaxID=45954 RepID=A0A9D4MFL0_DREPO|nr:hypothetical protein DPMN_000561 [Dreissena polymorpha]
MATVSHEAYLTEESEIADVSRLLIYRAIRFPTSDDEFKASAGEKLKRGHRTGDDGEQLLAAYALIGLTGLRVIRSLVTTNDHLLKELDEIRERQQHRGESD